MLIDDYSHVSLVYLLKDRTKVLSTIRKFLQEVTTQYAWSPKVLQTDNASKLVSMYIFWQTSCPHTFQQNGVAERKHRHILDMTRTFLYEMGVPHEFWADTILTSTFHINHLPSTPLGGKVPLRRLHLDRKLFYLPPCVFGCIAFAQDHSANKSNIAPHAVRGLFVGYLRNQKVYRIYLPHDRCYIISADVTFHEST